METSYSEPKVASHSQQAKASLAREEGPDVGHWNCPQKSKVSGFHAGLDHLDLAVPVVTASSFRMALSKQEASHHFRAACGAPARPLSPQNAETSGRLEQQLLRFPQGHYNVSLGASPSLDEP
ncbi:hypothetical protein P7K49_013948 [Saguinus oedipus]|uniref:Uncharacterized protein n=1 Tax=Saguinus oedipus TaxID=9490 RepID=A0ABQ9VHC7_SAGOE|nr:hypothetical protein P7K49_013948 [Saguinus oedipus]